jgi:hypothetical protein
MDLRNAYFIATPSSMQTRGALCAGSLVAQTGATAPYLWYLCCK